MVKRRDMFTLGTVIALVTLPTAGSLLYFAITKDPSIRPLGITQESLRAYSGEGGTGIEIFAMVEWDSARSGQLTREDMHHRLVNVFKSKGVHVRVFFSEGLNGTFVKYQVGRSVIGPYPQNRAAEGILAAVAAYRIHVPYKP